MVTCSHATRSVGNALHRILARAAMVLIERSDGSFMSWSEACERRACLSVARAAVWSLGRAVNVGLDAASQIRVRRQLTRL